MSGAVGIADTLLRGVGGRTVLLQMPAPAMNGDVGEQLGLATPLFQDIELGPVVFRKLRPKTGSADEPREATCELLVSASAVKKVVDSLACDAAELLFAQAAGVVIDGNTFGITSVTTSYGFGAVFLYHLGLRGAVKDFL